MDAKPNLTRLCPEDFPAIVSKEQRRGPYAVLPQSPSFAAVHVGTLDRGQGPGVALLDQVDEAHFAAGRVHSEALQSADSLLDEHGGVGPVERGDLQARLLGAAPVHVESQPVQRHGGDGAAQQLEELPAGGQVAVLQLEEPQGGGARVRQEQRLLPQAVVQHGGLVDVVQGQGLVLWPLLQLHGRVSSLQVDLTVHHALLGCSQ